MAQKKARTIQVEQGKAWDVNKVVAVERRSA